MDKQKIRWRCRRGMLELDLLLEGFLERGFDILNEEERSAFIELLELPDQELLGYLMKQQSVEGEVTRRVVEKIRASTAAD